MKIDYQAALTEQTDLSLRSEMLANLTDEDARLATWSPARGRTRFTAIIHDVVFPEDGEIKRHGNVTVEPTYIERATEVARAAGRGLALIHTHPCGVGWQKPSDVDIENEQVLLGRSTYGVTGLPLVGLILSGEGRWGARVYPVDRSGVVRCEECSAVRVVGRLLHVHFNPELIPPPEMVRAQRRTRTMWGDLSQAQIMRLRVGVIGAGSVGGIVAEVLARVGIGHLTLMDFDVVEDHNLDRLIYATKKDVRTRARKVSVLEPHLRASSTTPGFKIEPRIESIVEETGFLDALDCDVLFSCVDRNWPRQVLNHVAYSCLIPVVDGGVSIRLRDEGQLAHAVYRAQTVGPSRPCLLCLGMYDAGRIQMERDGVLEDPQYIESLGEEGRRQLEQERQNIMPFATGLASLEVLQFAELVTGVAQWGDLGMQQFDFLNGDLQSDHGRKCHPECEYVRMVGEGMLRPPVLGEDKARSAVEKSLGRRKGSRLLRRRGA